VKYPSALRKEIRLAVRLHWAVVVAGSGHLKWYDPEGKLRLTTSMTFSDPRGVLNAKAQLRKLGLAVT